MKVFSAFAMIVLALTLSVGSVGCKKGEEGKAQTPSGEEKYTVEGLKDQTIKVGDSEKVTIKVTRVKGFDGPIEVKLANLPDKVEATPAETTIGKENNSAEITLKAANDAKTVENQAVKVTTSGGGASKDVSFKLSVKGKG
ncbi:MAG: hypothetical protein L0Z62_17435 [Gemmataceae bacterium]|nr:hypothetical protein [Gemmataceae bacterium]